MQIVIVGGPRTGKTTMSEQIPGYRRSTDETMGMEWSKGSDEVSRWFDVAGQWVIEGVATARALRKWLAKNKSNVKPCDRVIVLEHAHVGLKPGQDSMGKGVMTVWREIEPELRRRGVEIVRSACS